jgi:predicted  nucleic acid-binding Zn-ribbon protein
MPDTPIPDSWTHYQKMVLSELERHEEKQDQLSRDLTDLRLLVANMAAVLNQNTESIKDLSKQIKQFEQSAVTQATDITLIKYKIGVAASIISTALTFLVQLGMKWLEKSGN